MKMSGVLFVQISTLIRWLRLQQTMKLKMTTAVEASSQWRCITSGRQRQGIRFEQRLARARELILSWLGWAAATARCTARLVGLRISCLSGMEMEHVLCDGAFLCVWHSFADLAKMRHAAEDAIVGVHFSRKGIAGAWGSVCRCPRVDLYYDARGAHQACHVDY